MEKIIVRINFFDDAEGKVSVDSFPLLMEDMSPTEPDCNYFAKINLADLKEAITDFCLIAQENLYRYYKATYNGQIIDLSDAMIKAQQVYLSCNLDAIQEPLRESYTTHKAFEEYVLYKDVPNRVWNAVCQHKEITAFTSMENLLKINKLGKRTAQKIVELQSLFCTEKGVDL